VKRAFLFSEQGEPDHREANAPKYEEISRTRLLEPDNRDPGRLGVWSHPAFANRSVYARNDHKIVLRVVSGGVKSDGALQHSTVSVVF
jgi:outer membrane protein assembly factor BamB